MERIFPEYYPAFRCIGSECRHNCCIGWEIDIDEETLAFYDSLEGPLRERMNRAICREPVPHFRLEKDERCPFLDDNNLCELISAFGEDGLCDICALHPRFCNEVDGRLEMGVGLCCEAAGRLILGMRERVTFFGSAGRTAVTVRRAEAIAIAQDRSRSLDDRLDALLKHGSCTLPDHSRWSDLLLSLERLDPAWEQRVRTLGFERSAAFEAAMADRQTEYEQILVYLLYRHFPRMGFGATGLAVLACRMLRAMGQEQWLRTGQFTPEDQVQLARAFSAEIEYSEENLNALAKAMTFAEIC